MARERVAVGERENGVERRCETVGCWWLRRRSGEGQGEGEVGCGYHDAWLFLSSPLSFSHLLLLAEKNRGPCDFLPFPLLLTLPNPSPSLHPRNQQILPTESESYLRRYKITEEGLTTFLSFSLSRASSSSSTAMTATVWTRPRMNSSGSSRTAR